MFEWHPTMAVKDRRDGGCDLSLSVAGLGGEALGAPLRRQSRGAPAEAAEGVGGGRAASDEEDV